MGYQISSHTFAARSRRFNALRPEPASITIPSDANPEAVGHFIAYIQGEKIPGSPDTFATLRRMADDWEVEDLQAELAGFLEKLPQPDEFLIHVLQEQIAKNLKTAQTCADIRSRFLLFVNDDRLMDLPLPVLTQVVNVDAPADRFNDIFAFLMRCLRRLGSVASILFRGLDMSQMNYGQLRELCGCKHKFFWGFADQSISDVVSALVNKVLELQVFRYLWQQHESNAQGTVQGLLPGADALDCDFGQVIAALGKELRDKTQELEDARLKQERIYDDRLVALDSNIKGQFEALRKELQDKTQKLEAANSQRAAVHGDELRAVGQRIDAYDRDMKGGLEALREQLVVEIQQIKDANSEREEICNSRVEAVEQGIEALNTDAKRELAALRKQLLDKTQQHQDDNLERERLCNNRVEAVEQRVEALNSEVKRELAALRKQLEDDTAKLETANSEQATVYDEKLGTIGQQIDGIDREMKGQLEALREELANRTQQIDDANLKLERTCNDRLDALNRDIRGEVDVVDERLQATIQRLEAAHLTRAADHDDKLSAIALRVDDQDSVLAALEDRQAEEQGKLRREIESKASTSDVDLLRTSLILHGSAILPIGGEVEETARTVTEILLGGESNVHALPFESLEGAGGVLSALKSQEAREMDGRQEDTEFHRHVIVSQSSNDLFSFVDPDSTNSYEGDDSGSNWIEFRFWRRIRLSGVIITSADSGFRRSFDICTGPDDQVVKSIRDLDLIGKGLTVHMNFNEIVTDQLKIRETSPSSQGNGSFKVGKIELFSLDPDYSRGVLRSLFDQHRTNIRQFIHIQAHGFDLEGLDKPGNQANVTASTGDQGWVQIELVDTKLVTTGYRLKRCSDHRLRSWSLRGSNDAMLPLDQWIFLDRRHEEHEDQFNDFASFTCFGRAFRYFRLVIDGPKWDGSTNLVLAHIDLYGFLISAVRKASSVNIRDAIQGLQRSVQEVDLLRCALGHCERSKPDERDRHVRMLAAPLFHRDMATAQRLVKLLPYESLERGYGVIGCLKMAEEQDGRTRQPGETFVRHVILSQSSHNLYSCVDPDSGDAYASSKSGSAWLEFRFWKDIRVRGMRIIAEDCAFPRSFDICYGCDNTVVKSIPEANLNGKRKEFVIEFDEIMTNQLKIRQTGQNWQGEQHFRIGKIEFLSSDSAFSSGVFRTLFKEHRTTIHQFVDIRARDFDMAELHKPDNASFVRTCGRREEWVQVEIVGGKLAPSCYRLQRRSDYRLLSWSLRASNDEKQAFKNWTVLDRRTEVEKTEHKDFDVFPAVSGPFRYFRLVCDGPNRENTLHLVLRHIDLFGVLMLDSAQ
jgi:hypothetical protein